MHSTSRTHRFLRLGRSKALLLGLALVGLGAAAPEGQADIHVRGASANATRPAAAQRGYATPQANSTKHGGGYGNGYRPGNKYGGSHATPGYGSLGHLSNGGLHVGFGSGGFNVGLSLGNCAPRPRWIPGRWDLRTERSWVPERCERVWRDALYETRYDSCGQPYRVQLNPAGYVTVTHPGYWDTRTHRVWIAGYYAH